MPSLFLSGHCQSRNPQVLCTQHTLKRATFYSNYFRSSPTNCKAKQHNYELSFLLLSQSFLSILSRRPDMRRLPIREPAFEESNSGYFGRRYLYPTQELGTLEIWCFETHLGRSHLSWAWSPYTEWCVNKMRKYRICKSEDCDRSISQQLYWNGAVWPVWPIVDITSALYRSTTSENHKSFAPPVFMCSLICGSSSQLSGAAARPSRGRLTNRPPSYLLLNDYLLSILVSLRTTQSFSPLSAVFKNIL